MNANIANIEGIETPENLHKESDWLAKDIIDKIKKILSIEDIPMDVFVYIYTHPLSIAEDPHYLDKFGYRFDGDRNWWI